MVVVLPQNRHENLLDFQIFVGIEKLGENRVLLVFVFEASQLSPREPLEVFIPDIIVRSDVDWKRVIFFFEFDIKIVQLRQKNLWSLGQQIPGFENLADRFLGSAQLARVAEAQQSEGQFIGIDLQKLGVGGDQGGKLDVCEVMQTFAGKVESLGLFGLVCVDVVKLVIDFLDRWNGEGQDLEGVEGHARVLAMGADHHAFELAVEISQKVGVVSLQVIYPGVPRDLLHVVSEFPLHFINVGFVEYPVGVFMQVIKKLTKELLGIVLGEPLETRHVLVNCFFKLVRIDFVVVHSPVF